MGIRLGAHRWTINLLAVSRIDGHWAYKETNMYTKLPISIEAGLMAEEVLANLEGKECHGGYTTGVVERAVRASSLTVLGRGAFGVAALGTLRSGKPVVLKFCGDPMDGYIWWAEFCKDNPAPHRPEIYYTARMGGLFVAVMKQYGCLQGQGKVIASELAKGGTLAEEEAFVHRIAKKYRIGVDLHSGNYMRDMDTGQIVITDPIAGHPESGKVWETYLKIPAQLELLPKGEPEVDGHDLDDLQAIRVMSAFVNGAEKGPAKGSNVFRISGAQLRPADWMASAARKDMPMPRSLHVRAPRRRTAPWARQEGIGAGWQWRAFKSYIQREIKEARHGV